MEKKKSNIGLIVTLVVLIMIILFGGTLFVLSSMGYVSFGKDDVKEDIDNKTDILVNNLNSELKNVIMFSLKTDQHEYGKKTLVAVDSDGNEIDIYDLSEYYGGVHYDYDEKNGIIYLFLYTYEKDNHRDENEKRMLGYIDLTEGNGNYNLEILTEINVERDYFSGMDADYIAKTGDYIYFSNKNLYRYNIKTGQVEDTKISSSNRTMTVLSYNDEFVLYNVNNKLYLLNINDNSSTIISENGSLGYIYDNEFIYLQVDGVDENGNTLDYYYSYNFDTKEKEKISDSIGIQATDLEYIVPFKDTYIYLSYDLFMSNGDKFYSISCDSLGLSSNDYNCEEISINYLTKFGDNRLFVQVTDMGISGGNSVMNVIFDVNKKSVIDVLSASNEYYYIQVTYLK